MATAKQFLDAIELEKLVSDDVLDDLYEEYRSSGGAVTADSMAAKLVAKGHLSQDKANVLLMSPSDSFIQVGADSLSAKKKPVADNPFGDDDAEEGAGDAGTGAGRRKHVKKTHKNDHDSPLILIGGGALGLLLLGGIGLYLLMGLQSGDQLIDSAKSAYSSGSYSQAREEYEAFVEDFTTHLRWSEARVALSVVKLRQLVEGSTDWDRALSLAQEELPKIEDEPAFPEARAEFASLVPRITRGLAKQADEASAADDGSNAEEVDKLVARTKDALKILGNTKYVPKSQRDDAEIAEFQELLARVGRRREALADLNATLAAIGSATASDDAAAAYRSHAEFVSRRPGLREDERLASGLAEAIEAERQTIRFVEDAAEAATEERPSPIALAIPLATPSREGTTSASGLFTRQLAGVLYGLKPTDGSLIWRRPVGERLAEVLTTPIGKDLLVIDHRHGELLRIKASSSKLVWRVALEEPGEKSGLNQPVSVGDRVLVSSESGRLWSVDAATGRRLGYAAFAQPLRAAPAVDQERGRAYVVGEQSSLYTLDAETLACQAVRYTGHARGSISVAPIFLDGWVMTLENAGEATSRLNVYSTDDSGAIASQLADWRLDGVASTPIGVFERRLLVATESGATYLYELVGEREGQPLTLLASRGAESGPPQRRYAVEVDGGVWIAGEGLRRTAASPADSSLVSRNLADACDRDLFIGPLETRGNAILHSRRTRDGLGAVVAASDTRSGELVWETSLAAPPAVAPAISRKPQGVVATTLAGHTHLIDSAAIRARVSAEPAAEPSRSTRYEAAVSLGSGEAVLMQKGSKQWLRTALTPRASARVLRLPGELASRPAKMAKYLVTPLSIGQVHLLDSTGKQIATPFQPRVEVGTTIDWTPPAVAQVAGQRLVVLSDGESIVYSLRLNTSGDPTLEEAGTYRLEGSRPATGAAIVGQRAAIGLEDSRIAFFDLPAMGGQSELALPAGIAWGPFAAGERLLVGTDDGRLLAIDPTGTPRIAWQAELGTAGAIGEPLVSDGVVTIVSPAGLVRRLSLADGAEQAKLDLGQKLGSGATAYGTRLLLAAADGTVLVVNQP